MYVHINIGIHRSVNDHDDDDPESLLLHEQNVTSLPRCSTLRIRTMNRIYIFALNVYY